MLHYQTAGRGPLLVLLHGITENNTIWDSVIEPLASSHRVVAPDLRGHGRSLVEPPYDMLTFVQDVHTTLDTVAPQETPLLVGHSFGAMIATVYAAMYPVRAVVNVEQPLDLSVMRHMVVDLIPELRTPRLTEALDAFFAELEAGALPPELAARLKRLRRYDQDVVLGIWDGGLLEATPAELAELTSGLLNAITAPYLALHGSEPDPAYRAWLATTQADVTVEAWPGGGHYPHLLDPERFADRVRRMDAAAAAAAAKEAGTATATDTDTDTGPQDRDDTE